MPRGRPKKAASVAVIEQPKKPVEPPKKKPTQEPIVTIFSETINDISEPVDGPVAEAVVDESKNSDETVDEGVQDSDVPQNVGSVAQVLYDKCLRELESFDAARTDIQVRIDEREVQCELLQSAAQEAIRVHSLARAAHGELKRAIALQESRTKLAENTSAWHSARQELDRLLSEARVAQETVDEAVKALEEAQNGLAHISELQDATLADKQETARIYERAALMQVLRDEQRAIRGREILDKTRRAIEDIEGEIGSRELDLMEAKGWLKDVQNAIPSLLGEWPELADRLIASHGVAQAPISVTPATRVMKAWIQFVRVLGQEGHSANVRVNNKSRNLVDVLALPSGVLAEFLAGGKWRKRVTYDKRNREVLEDVTNETEVVEQLIREQAEIQKRRMELPAWWTR